MEIVFTGKAQQRPYSDLETFLDPANPVSTDELHVVRCATPPLYALYATEDMSLADAQGSLFYHAEDQHSLDVDQDVLQATLTEMCAHFLGVPPVDIMTYPERFEGLPFWSLMIFGGDHLLFPVSRVPQLASDFINVGSDGEEEQFRQQMTNNPGDHEGEEVWETYVNIKALIASTHNQQGSFYYNFG